MASSRWIHQDDGVIPTGAIFQAKGGISRATGPASQRRASGDADWAELKPSFILMSPLLSLWGSENAS
jgi:hypothetical protein